MLLVQSQGPEFRPLGPTENLGVVAYICNPNTLWRDRYMGWEDEKDGGL